MPTLSEMQKEQLYAELLVITNRLPDALAMDVAHEAYLAISEGVAPMHQLPEVVAYFTRCIKAEMGFAVLSLSTPVYTPHGRFTLLDLLPNERRSA